MISENVLNDAVDRRLITSEQASALIALAQAERRDVLAAEPDDDEKLRFITGFGDIFVTIGLLLFLGALSYLVLMRVDNDPLYFAGAVGIIAAASWGLAEFFTRKRRMALPSIVLLIAFVASAGAGFVALLVRFIVGDTATPDFLDSGDASSAIIVLGATALTILAAYLHYFRFRVPITVAAATATLAGGIIWLLSTVAPEAFQNFSTPVILFLGLAIFALAMRFDLSDPERLTRRTDIAFWLHLLAAPMIVHPLIRVVMASEGTGLSASSAFFILGIFLLLGLVAVLVDRRAILVSGLSYAGFALGSLVQTFGFEDIFVPITLLLLGAIVLGLSAGWRWLRMAILRLLPGPLVSRLSNAHLSGQIAN